MPETTPSLPQFLHALRAVMRQSHAVAVVSVPAHLMQVGMVIVVSSWTNTACYVERWPACIMLLIDLAILQHRVTASVLINRFQCGTG